MLHMVRMMVLLFMQSVYMTRKEILIIPILLLFDKEHTRVCRGLLLFTS